MVDYISHSPCIQISDESGAEVMASANGKSIPTTVLSKFQALFAPKLQSSLPRPDVDLELAEPAAAMEDKQILGWEKIMVAFCLGSSVEIAVLFVEKGSLPLPFNFLSLAISLAFTSLCVSKFIGSRFPGTERVLDHFAGLFMFTAFYTAVTIPFPFWLKCCTWAVYAISLAAIFICNYL
ncbi:hypothetical protein SLE2022_365090 [Rubroshorea leprosula]